MQRTALYSPITLGALVALTCLFAPPIRADEPTAPTLIDNFHASLVDMMKSSSGLDARRSLIAPVIKRTFDTATISRIALGRYWRLLNTDQQTKVIDQITQLLVANYAGRFSKYTGQQFIIDQTLPLTADREMVQTHLLIPDGDTVNLHYQLSHRSGKWLVYDIIAAGVSDLSLKRTQYTHAYEQGGLDAVIKAIDAGIKAADE